VRRFFTFVPCTLIAIGAATGPWGTTALGAQTASGLPGTSPAPALAPAPTPLPPADARLATRQLVWPLDSAAGFLNGSPVSLALPSRVVGGRTLLPLAELARVLGLPLEPLEGGAGMRLGRLELYPAARFARLDGRQLPLEEVGAVLDGALYVAARTLEASVGATVVFDAVQRLLTVTVFRERPSAMGRPVARFATDKREYRLGEPVRITEYSYDPDGLPLTGKRFTGREEAYFSPGVKEISLTVTNAAGRTSEPYALRVSVGSEALASPRDYALRFTPLGRTFVDPNVLAYPSLSPERQDEATPLILSDSPETPDRSGLVYEETVSGTARIVAHHLNAMAGPARLLVLATNLEPAPVEVQAYRLGETSATRIVATLGQASLLDFLTSGGRDRLRLGPGGAAALYASPGLAPGAGLNLMADLETTGRVQLSFFFLEEGLFPPGAALPPLTALRSLPVLEPDGRHIRGTFPGAVRRLRLDLAAALREGGAAARLILCDGQSDPALAGRDALTGKPAVLAGNYGATYLIRLENAGGTVGAIVPRGGPYSGAIRVNGAYMALPENGVLLRNDAPLVLYRDPPPVVEFEFVPASGSFLPVNLVFYRPAAPGAANAVAPSR
jgi:hypothetical protein